MLPVHGGDLLSIAAAFGIDPDRLIDFSANINPFGPPRSVLDAVARTATDVSSLTRYPQPRAPRLAAKVAARFGINRSQVVIGHGSAGLLDAIVHAFRPQVAFVPVPAFSEYHRVCEATGCEFVPFVLNRENDFRLDPHAFTDALRKTRPDILLLSNPHNPSGSLLSHAEVIAIANAAHSIGAVTIVDEAFIDYVPKESVLQAATASESLVVLRSFTKFYAFPGLRVGYAVASAKDAQRIERALPSWPVSSFALTAAEAALDDPTFEHHTLKHNAIERKRVTEAIASLGIRVTPSVANYLLLDCSRIAETGRTLRENLIINHNIIVRDCDDYASLERSAFIRIAIRGMEDNNRLIAALALFVPLVVDKI